jgi:hypothetical protein
MNLNDIKLPASLVASLYHHTLVEGPEQLQKEPTRIAVPAEKNPEPEWKYKGGNRKNILVILDYRNDTYLPENETNFFSGILTACKLDLQDVAIINMNNHPDATYKELMNYFKSKTLLLFGVEPASIGLPLSFPHFQVQSFANATFLFAPVLKELEDDKLLKSKFWVCLRKVFGI